ncbi:PREDICTED: formin-1 [Dipodomys ordii]|uniref:Formin-1 n=1 Tax=Dipodomys ordii TaxID=10020 RepID=A0A1S3EZB9_DIPOR|nr:PREDICTED: formin-1 [Dipodomys ordii]
MEGTHCTLQLHAPITELCYISFYLPRGEARGFSYKGTVTLDRSNKGFQNCYQVREGSDISSLTQHPNEQIGDIFFKQTPTKDILTELYKLTAEKERLLANLLSSDHILGISSGSQGGKLSELPVSLVPEDGCVQSAGDWLGELPASSLSKRSSHGRRRESSEAFLQKRKRRKGSGRQKTALQMGKDQICSSNSFPLSPTKPNLRLLKERGNLVPNGAFTHALQRRESCPADIPRILGADLGSGSFRRASEGSGLGREVLPADSRPTEARDDCVQKQPRSTGELEPQQTNLPDGQEEGKKPPEAERYRAGKCKFKSKSVDRTCRRKPVLKVVARIQEPATHGQHVVRTHPEGEGWIDICPEAQHQFIPQETLLTLPEAEARADGSSWQGQEKQGDRSSQSSVEETASASACPASAEGAVNKVLLKVIERDRLAETTEGRRLGLASDTRATHGFLDARSQRRPGLPQSGLRPLSLDLPHPVGADSSPPTAPAAAPGMGFNNSSPQSSIHKRLSPVPLPPPPRHPRPQLHHRILQLPPLPSERDPAFNDSPHRKSGVSSGLPSAATLEQASSAKVTETGQGAWPASFSVGQPGPLPGGPLEKILELEKTTAQLEHQPPPGYSTDGFSWDSFNEQTTRDLPNRDGGDWVLGYRAGPPCPFLLHEEREKPHRSDLYLDLNPDQSPTELDDRTPGRLQAVWPPPRTKDTEEKVGLKYTEAEYQAAILHLKREHKEEVENLQPPPPGLFFGPSSSPSQGPRKPAVEPGCPMKPLYWTRIQISDRSQNATPTLWDSLEEPNIRDTSEFEYLFSKETTHQKKKPLSETYEKKNKVKKIIKLLDGKRSQAVGILISSLHLEMKDIQQAIFTVDESVVDLETLAALYENRAQEDELVKIRKYYETSTDENLKLLDKPEQFLHELAQIPNFAERAQCIIFRSVFSESINSLHRKIEIVTRASEGLLSMKSVKDILALILAFGNYMNGGNRTRGQADGYSLEILPKLKDVKSRDNGINLVDYVVKYYLRYYDQEAGTEKSVFPLPEPQDLLLASQVRFEDLVKDLRKLKRQLEACEQQMVVVCKESPKEFLQPFKSRLEEFFQKAKKEHKAEEAHLEKAQKSFETTVGYFEMKPKAGEKEITPSYVFTVWYEFCSDFKTIWKRESKNISKERLKMAQASVSKLTAEKKVETKKIDPAASLKERLRQKEASVTTH